MRIGRLRKQKQLVLLSDNDALLTLGRTIPIVVFFFLHVWTVVTSASCDRPALLEKEEANLYFSLFCQRRRHPAWTRRRLGRVLFLHITSNPQRI